MVQVRTEQNMERISQLLQGLSNIEIDKGLADVLTERIFTLFEFWELEDENTKESS